MNERNNAITRAKMFVQKINNRHLDNPKLKRALSFSIIGLLFVMAYMVFALYAIRPFNYVMIGIAIIQAILIFSYVLLFGRFVFNVYQFLMLIFYLFQLFAYAMNGFRYISSTPLLLAMFGVVLSEFYSQDGIPKKTILRLFAIAGWLFELTFLLFEFRDVVHPNFGNRIGALFGNENDVGRNFALVFMLNFGLIFEPRKRKPLSLLFLISCVLAFYFILLTGSVSNVVATILVSLIYFYIKTPRKKKWLFLILVLVSTVAVVIFLQFPAFSYFKKRIDGMINAFGGDGSVDMSFLGRWNAAKNGLLLFFESPIYGYGERAISFYYFIGTTHNNFTDILCNYGIFAFIAYESLVLIPVIQYIKAKEKRSEAAMAIILYTFVFQLFLYSYNFKADMMMIPFAYCMLDIDFRWNQYLPAIGFSTFKGNKKTEMRDDTITYGAVKI